MTAAAPSIRPSGGVSLWFCLRSQPRHEHIAAAHLRSLPGVEVFLPRIRFQRATRQGKAWVTEALFPGYLFARFDWHTSLRAVQHARGVSRVVHFGDRWPTLEPELITDLQRAVGTAEAPRVVPMPLNPGDEVTITTGAFHGLSAVVTQVLPGRQRVTVLLDFLGRQTSVQLSEDSVFKPGEQRASLL